MLSYFWVLCPTLLQSLLASQRSFPQAICTVSCPSSILSRSLPAKLSLGYLHGFLSVQHAVSFHPSEALPKLFARFPLRPACCLAPSRRSSPQAISTLSSPSSMLSRSLPAKLSARYFHVFLSVQHAVSLPPGEALSKLFPRFPLRPACCLAPSQRNSPQAISTFSCPSSMLSRSPPSETLSASYLQGFLSVQHAVSLPSQQSTPQAICTVSSPSSILSRFLPAKLSPRYLHGFLSVQHAVSLPPSEAFRTLFARFPLRLANSLTPSQRSFPHAICAISSTSSMLSRSLPAKLSASYLHGFLSIQHAVSLPPKAFRKLFAWFPVRPAYCLAPSQRSSPQAICTVSCPSSMLSRSLPATLSPSYSSRFAWGGRPHRRFISVREWGLTKLRIFTFPPRGGSPS